ncbi:hypothetical protein [Sinorhizobium meliloti]|uniref:hypothetical protein n=1 Tax=Rhizobium meliloti TaxID=382 RepID=UPI00299D8862|nr:hypothetical protein [Sinorhizobium meliloti]
MEVDSGEQYPVFLLAADSRISRGSATLTDIAPKILSINMVSADKNQRRRFFQQYGFAYAGSVTSAFLVHSTAQYLTTNLFSNHDAPPPTVSDVARIYSDIAHLHLSEYGARLAPQEAKAVLFDCIVCGYEVSTGDLRAFHIQPELEDELRIKVAEIGESNSIFRAGAGSEEFDRVLSDLLKHDKDVDCRSVIVEMIGKRAHRTVGGFVQVAQADRHGFSQLAHLAAQDTGDAIASYLGVDLAVIHRPEGYKFAQSGWTSIDPETNQTIRTKI